MTISFYLRPTKDPKTGVLAHCITDGGKVLERRSYNVRVERRYWEKKNQRVTKHHPDYDFINCTIDTAVKEFTSNQGATIKDLEKTPVLKVLHDLVAAKVTMEKSNTTIHKYHTIISNFRKALREEFGHEDLHIGQLRDIKIVESIIQSMKVSATTKRKEKYKSSRCLKNYCSFIAQAIEFFNGRSGIITPINSLPFRLKLGRDLPLDKIEHAKVFSIEDLEAIESYLPQKNRGKENEMNAKHTFLFQYYGGGLRWIDAALLTNKDIVKDFIKFNHLKTGNIQSKSLNFPMCRVLSIYFPSIYEKVIKEVRVGDIKFDFAGLVQIQKLVGPRAIYKMNVEEINSVLDLMTQQNLEDSQEFGFLEEVKYQVENKITNKFFKDVKELPIQFLLPIFKIDDFTPEEIETQKFTMRSATFIHKRRANFNNTMARICNRLGIQKLTGHSARHTFARFLLENGMAEHNIRDCLGHKRLSSTHAYLQGRHPITEHERQLKQIMEANGYR